MNPVKDGIRKAHASPVEACGLEWFVHVPGGKFGPQPEVGAVVDLVVADQGLRELHPQRALHRGRRAVDGVVAPRGRALVVELDRRRRA